MGVSANSGSSVERIKVDGACPSCGATAMRRYPALSEGGWFLVTKCQECLKSMDRTPWNKLGYVTREENTL